MKKITFSLLFAFATFSFAYSQGLKLIQPGGSSYTMKDTLIWGNTTNEMLFPLNLVNTSANTDTIAVTSDTSGAILGTSKYVCWDNHCTPVNNYTYVIPPGDTAKLGNVFSAEYFPNGHTGTSIIKYIFYDKGKRNTVADTFTATYVTSPSGIAELSDGQNSFSAPYPNPANTNVSFNYSLTNGAQAATLKVFNLLGDCIQTISLSASQNKTTINVQSMPSGIYVCEMQAEGSRSVYQKLIVSH
jgi:hypothetical protein